MQEDRVLSFPQAISMKRLDGGTWQTYRPRLLAFIQRYGEKRIARRTLVRLATDEALAYDPEGGIWVAHAGGRVLGVLAVRRAGIVLSMIVVHPLYRRAGIGVKLLNEAVRTTKRLYARISADNAPSLRLAKSTGFTIIDRIVTRSGQTIVIVARGAWQKKEAKACVASVF